MLQEVKRSKMWKCDMIWKHEPEPNKWNEKCSLKENKSTCAGVTAVTTMAHNKSKQHSFNAKVNFSLVLLYTWCSLLSISKLTLSQDATNMLLTCPLPASNMFLSWTQHPPNLLSTFSKHAPWSLMSLRVIEKERKIRLRMNEGMDGVKMSFLELVITAKTTMNGRREL